MTSEAFPFRRGRTAICAMFLVNGAILGSWALQIPFLLPRHGITESVLGLLILLMGLGAMAAMAVSGALLGRFGSRAVLRAGAVACALALAAAALAPTLPLCAVAMAGLGATVALMDVAANAHAVELEESSGRAMLSTSHGFWSVGGFLGGALGGAAVATLGGTGHVLAVAALSLVVTGLAGPRLIAAPAPAAMGMTAPDSGFLRQPAGIYLLGVMALLSFVPESAILDWSALYLSRDHETGVAASGLAFALFSAAMAAMRFCGDGLRNRVGAVPLLFVSGLVGAAGLAVVALAPSAPVALAGFVVTGLGLANMVPLLFAAAGRQGGANPGAAIAAVSLIGYGGMLVAPSVLGVVAERIGFAACFLGLAALLLGVALLSGRVAAPGPDAVPAAAE